MDAKTLHTDVDSCIEDDATSGVNYVEEARRRAATKAPDRNWLDFPLLKIKGEPLSATIIRERRGQL
jgi:hypothetical protein